MIELQLRIRNGWHKWLGFSYESGIVDINYWASVMNQELLT